MTISRVPHLYSSAIEAALAGAVDTGSPCYSSELYLGRPFVLTDDGFFWAHYAVHAQGCSPQAYRTAKADELAAIFCGLLAEQQPEAMLDFKHESTALQSYCNGTAPVSTALNAVFDAASQLHRIQAETFQYDGFDRGVHTASVWDRDGTEYFAVFDEQLVLTQVSELRSRLGQAPRVWPTGD